MQLNKLYTALLILVSIVTNAQTVEQKAANDAFIITRMADKFHVKPRAVNDTFSNDVFKTIIHKVDPSHLTLTQDDIKQLSSYRDKLGGEILNKRTSFIQLLTSIYSDRLQLVDTMAENLLKMPFRYNIAEKYTTQEDTTNPVNLAALRIKLYKKFKYAIVSSIAIQVKDIKDPTKQKKKIDSLDIVLRKKVLEGFKLNIQKKLQSPGGIPQIVSNDYCKAIAACYDPHTEYMTMSDRDNFESQIGKKNLILGFNLNEDQNGNVTIDKLVPGSAAFKSGLINKGDKIISIQWEGAKPIDVTKADAEEIEDILDVNNHVKVTLTVLKSDGTKRQVDLMKEKQTIDEDDNKVKSYILKGAKTLGYISLPSFYEDWEDKKSINGCANDVAKEVLKLKKENIEGLILDVRFNGGGSIDEAVDLAGIFIDAGPITQIQTRNSKPITLKDMNRGTIFDGPITLMVNGYSASASELLAGVLQDYNRALIVGSATYGKATGQGIFPLDTTFNDNQNTNDTTKRSSFLKLTELQVYQVSGKTAQFKGVVPDILLPDATEADNNKEKNEPFAIPSGKIEANKYYLPCKPLPLEMLQTQAAIYQKENPYFAKVTDYINEKKNKQVKVDISLKLDDLLNGKSKIEEDDDDDVTDSLDTKLSDKENKFFTVQLNKYESERVASDSDLKSLDDKFQIFLSKDPYLLVTYRLMLLMTK